jgi:hypothetical protein
VIRGRLALLASLALPLLAGCTHDFGSFSYRDDGGASTVAASQAGSDAGGPQSPDVARDGSLAQSRPDAAPHDGGRETIDAGGASMPDAGGAVTDASDTADAADATDAAADAGTIPPSPETMVCREVLQANGGSESCASCSCGSCAGEVASCLGSTDGDADPLCAAVVSCAIQNDCQFWSCYCRTPQCARTAPTGDGPCVAAIEAAAGGAKAVVMAKWASTDLADPLVRARNLVACTLGLDAQHPLGPINGQCADPCR